MGYIGKTRKRADGTALPCIEIFARDAFGSNLSLRVVIRDWLSLVIVDFVGVVFHVAPFP